MKSSKKLMEEYFIARRQLAADDEAIEQKHAGTARYEALLWLLSDMINRDKGYKEVRDGQPS